MANRLARHVDAAGNITSSLSRRRRDGRTSTCVLRYAWQAKMRARRKMSVVHLDISASSSVSPILPTRSTSTGCDGLAGVFDSKGFDLNRLGRDWRPGRRR